MRVIAGSLKGRHLKAPTWDGLRPTSDKLRETLFNILAGRIDGARVMDGYAGTGALGIEAISRGASHVTFVERDRRARALIAANLTHCGIENGYAIIRASVTQALEVPPGAPLELFDIILFDPPYAERPDEVIAAAGERLAASGVLVLEHARRRPAPESAGRLVRSRAVMSGDSALAFYSWPP
jgi:16S rRNA (guanine966-N2)-methyltransferase